MKSKIKCIMFNRQEKILIFILAFIQFSHIVDFMILMPLGPQLMRIFEITPQQFGVIVSCYTFAAGVSGIASAFFMDKFDRKSALLFFYTGFCFGTIACALSPNYYFLLAARTLTGVFGGVLGSLCLSILGDAIAPAKRGTAMGLMMSSFSFASIAGVPFSLFLANHFNWHAPFMFLGCVSSLLILVIWKVVPSIRGHMEHKHTQNPLQLVISLIRENSTRTAILFSFLLIFAQFLIIPFLSPSLVANAKMAELDLPFIYLVGGSFSMFSSPLAGRLADRFGRMRVYVIGAVLSIIPIILITHLGVTPLWLILTVIALFFTTTSFRWVPAMAIITSTVTPQRRGGFMSLVSSLQNFASSIASLIAGAVVVKTATGELSNYGILGFLSAAVSLIAIWAATKIRVVE